MDVQQLPQTGEEDEEPASRRDAFVRWPPLYSDGYRAAAGIVAVVVNPAPTAEVRTLSQIMVGPALQSAIEAMSLDERLQLVEYIESTVDHASIEVSKERRAMIRTRAAEVQTDPSIGLTLTSSTLGSAHAGRDGTSPGSSIPGGGGFEVDRPLLHRARAGTAARFRARLKEQADRLLMFPEYGAILFESYRRVLLRRSPYMAVRLVSDERIDVLALVDDRRDPA